MKTSEINFGSTAIAVGSYGSSKQKGDSLANICEKYQNLVDEGRVVALLFVDGGSFYQDCYINALRSFLKEQNKEDEVVSKQKFVTWSEEDLEIIYSSIDNDVLDPDQIIKNKIIEDDPGVMDFTELCRLYSDELKTGIEKFDLLYKKDSKFKQHVDLDVETFANKQFVALKKMFPELDLHPKREKLLPFLIQAAIKYLKTETAFREIVINGLKVDYEFYPGEQNATMKYFQWHYYKFEDKSKQKGKWKVLEGTRTEEHVNSNKLLKENDNSLVQTKSSFFPKENKKHKEDNKENNKNGTSPRKESLLQRIMSNIYLLDGKYDFNDNEIITIEKEVLKTMEQQISQLREKEIAVEELKNNIEKIDFNEFKTMTFNN